MNQVFIGIGSNKSHPYFRVHRALKQINRIHGTRLLKKSSLYETIPLGPKSQPNFINAVVKIETMLTPQKLLEELKYLEKLHNRKTTKRWGPRSLDLDILIYNQVVMDSEDLTIPHPGVEYREFVLIPLYEITRYDFEVPKFGKINKLIKRL